MSSSDIRKLLSLTQALTPKDTARLVISYFLKQDEEGISYEDDIRSIVDFIPQNEIPDYNFYWHLYRNVEHILLDFQSKYLELKIKEAQLSKLHYCLFLAPYFDHLHSYLKLLPVEYDEDIDHALTIIDAIQLFKPFTKSTISSENQYTLQFTHDSYQEVFVYVISEIKELIRSLNGYGQIITQIEKKYFDDMQIVSRKGIMSDVFSDVEKIINDHAKQLQSSLEFYNRFNRTDKITIDSIDTLKLEYSSEFDEQWVKETIEKLVHYAERDSYFRG